MRLLPTPLTLLRHLVICGSVATAFAAGAAWQPGEALPQQLTLKDQHEKVVPVTRETRIIFLAAEMGASRMMAKALEALPASTLQARNAVYIADISAMPEPIASIVAVPRMRKLPYPVAVVRHSDETARMPRKSGAVTVLQIADGRVVAVEYAHTTEQLGRYLR